MSHNEYLILQKLIVPDGNLKEGSIIIMSFENHYLHWFYSGLIRQISPHDKENTSGGQNASSHDNGEYEVSPVYGSLPDGEFDKQYPFQPDGTAWQYQNHDYHHNRL